MYEFVYPAAAVGVVALVTWALRAFPFLAFGGRPLPKTVRYLAKALPPAIMTALVVFCLKDTEFARYPYGIPALVSAAAVVILQAVKKNMYVSIVAGTVCYMVLIRVL